MCYNCKKPSHFAKDCPEPKREALHAIYDDTGELVETIVPETLNALVEQEGSSLVTDDHTETPESVNTSSGETCSLNDGSDYDSCSCESGERLTAMRSLESDSPRPVFTLRDPVTREWIIWESMDGIVETLQQ